MKRETTLEERIFHAVADPTRRALLDRLSSEDLSVLDLARPLPMSQPAVSQHLAILRRAGLVRSRRAGRRRVYRLRAGALERVREWAAQFTPETPAGAPAVAPVRPLGRLLEFRGPRFAASPIVRARTIAVPVSDVERSLAFYREQLELEVRRDETSPDGRRRVEVAPPDAETAIELLSTDAGDPHSAGATVVFVCRDLASARRHFSERGIVTARADVGGKPGLRLKDPDGNVLLLTAEP